ncbi:BrnT family toxin [Methylobacterium aquaticum]|uniref:BrnT family toxin n=1 Tax=Methylobacterium aquaticum TaxID=270351 RepID=UPI000A74BD09|nr:BrnT family toxin [Methylobacterium aquaticum]
MSGRFCSNITGVTIRFEWDPAKAASNLRKHGVSFEEAARVFSDPFALTQADRVEGGELRWLTIGRVGSAVLLAVAHADREEDDNGGTIEIIRIISARFAGRVERRRYANEAHERHD